jgi:GNAT superfamily N-acetyltransferase
MIEVLLQPTASDDLDGLATLLMDAVASGASVSFMNTLDWPAARAWWERELAAPSSRGFTIVSRDAEGIAGCVVLKPAWAPNQPHRADVCKLLVHRRARGRGLGRALMAEVERRAWGNGFTLLTLDTVPGRPADELYRSAGWTPVGVVPGYALDPDGSVCDTRIFYKAAPDTAVDPSR